MNSTSRELQFRSATGKTRAYYVASTHWDREWYESFQEYRFRLVRVLDEVLDVMAADPAFRCFQTDGVSIIVDDYLEIRPERREQVRRLAAAGRLRIGPWYTMPDEHLVSGESLIRNLEYGIRTAEKYGPASRVGFVCDTFGHISQLPQILRGFSIDHALLWRGTSEDTHGGLFWWRGADGSRVVAHRFGVTDGYCAFANRVRRASDPAKPFSLDDGFEGLKSFVHEQHQRVDVDAILLFDGADHLEIEPGMPSLLARAAESMPDVAVVHAGLDEYMRDVLRQADRIRRTFDGELHEPGRLTDDACWLIPGVLSSRVNLKLANRRCEDELILWAEPFATLAAQAAEHEYPARFLTLSWQYLLTNHAHDSICGCSIDQVHRDMIYRFDQSYLISHRASAEALEAIASRVERPELGPNDFALVVFNPAQMAIDGPVDLTLRFPHDTTFTFHEFFWFEAKMGFRLFDAAGNELAYDYISHRRHRRSFRRPRRKMPVHVEQHEVDVTLPLSVPAFGYTRVVCRPQAGPTRHLLRPIAVGDSTLENEHLRVRVNPNGSLSLEDKRSGQTYDRLLVYEQRADIGDGWYHGVAVNDEIFTSTACPADVALVEHGTFKATLRIAVRMRVPECWQFDSMTRSDRHAELRIESFVTLRRGADSLDVRTVVHNHVRDHRLRVLFESGAKTDTYFADSAFDVIERTIALPDDNHTYKELALETRPQANWTAVHDGTRGLAVVSPDLYESCVRDVPERTLALTLLRAFQRSVFTNGEEGGQVQGRHEFRYLLVPLCGDLPRTHLTHLAQRTAGGVRGVQVGAGNDRVREQPPLASTGGLMRPGGAGSIITSLRRREDGRIELRLHNPTDHPLHESVTFDFDITSARSVDFEGRTLATIPSGRRELFIDLGPKQIVTLAIESPHGRAATAR